MPDESLYLVFARKKYDEPLAEIGAVSAEDGDEARQAALRDYPDPDWVEMIAIPRGAVVPVIEDGSA